VLRALGCQERVASLAGLDPLVYSWTSPSSAKRELERTVEPGHGEAEGNDGS
jgi:hypothetical protein